MKDVAEKLKIVAVVQGTDSDLYASDDPDNYCINAIKQSGLFSDIVIATPITDSESVLKLMADKWGVSIYFGSVYDVADRFYNLAIQYKADVLVRIQLRAFYVDMEMVKRLIEKLGTQYDYVDVDNDTNYALGADVFTTKALKCVLDKISAMPDNHQKRVFQFSPWAILNNREMFKVAVLKYDEMWKKDKIRKIKEKLSHLINEEENKQAVCSGDPGGRYNYIRQFISPGDTVLDIACGQGGGTRILSRDCKKIYGVDYNKKYIDAASDKFQKDNISFLVGSDFVLKTLNVTFDKVVSLHTLEHVENDLGFLMNINDCLKKTGKLILEVPRLLKFPLGEPLYPFHDREYDLDSMRSLLTDSGFEIELEKGGNRNLYVNVEHAREVLFFVCRKK